MIAVAKTMTIQVLDNTITFDNQQEGENNATTLTVDFTGCGVDNFVKWVDFRASDETATAVELGTGIIETIAIPNSLTKQGVLEIQAYAKDGTTVYMGKVFRVQVKRSLNVVGDTTEYDIGVVEALQNSVSNMQIQVDEIWEAYNTGELDGEDGLDGVSVNSIAFIGNDLVFTMSDLTVRTLFGAKLDLKGETGAQGVAGKTIVSASFVGNDLVFTLNDATTVTLVGAKLSLKGDQGVQGIQGTDGIDGVDGSNFTILGQYATLLALQTAHPTGSAGDAWAVGTSESSDLYIWDTVTNSWKDIGQVGINMTADSVTVEDLDENYAGITVEEILAELPSKFSETTHVHTISEVTGLDTVLVGKANTSHTHATSDVTGLDTALAGKASSTHSHSIGDVTGLESELGSKADASHTHAISDITNLQTTLDGKAPLDSPALTGTPTISGRTIISNNTSTGTALTQIWSGTQEQYNAIGTKSASTLYFIV